ncbi:hypothetical protein GQ600_2150 [Phytophthora cactorum]|nr:hypothetical protein GQ600_2150 [Phytophthora cactorum]
MKELRHYDTFKDVNTLLMSPQGRHLHDGCHGNLLLHARAHGRQKAHEICTSRSYFTKKKSIGVLICCLLGEPEPLGYK